MSTFMTFGCLDVKPGADVEPVLEAMVHALSEAKSDQKLTGNIVEYKGRTRIPVNAEPGVQPSLDELFARAAEETGTVERAVVAADHDEFGAEHAVFDGRAGSLKRVHHVYVYPEGQIPETGDDEEHAPALVAIPIRDGLTARPDGTVDALEAWGTVAGLYDVPPGEAVKAARQSESAYEKLGSAFEPFEAWWHALDVPYPGPPNFAESDFELARDGVSRS